MPHQTYTIYFNGTIAANFNPVEVKKRAQAVFKLSEKNAEIFFNGEKHILKENLSQEECEKFIKRLSNIGLVAHTNPPLITLEATPLSTDKVQKPTKSKLLTGITLLITGVAMGWLLSFINFDKLNDPPATPSYELNQPTDIMGESKNTSPPKDQTDNLNLINECTSDAVINLLEKILIQGIPQLIQNSSPNTQLTMQNYSYNQEVYFDPHRNKRLCGVLSQYKVKNSDNQNAAKDFSITYEIIYEIEKEQDQSIKLSTFRHRVLSPPSPNVDTTNTNAQNVEQS